jgi:hypothetical protein
MFSYIRDFAPGARIRTHTLGAQSRMQPGPAMDCVRLRPSAEVANFTSKTLSRTILGAIGFKMVPEKGLGDTICNYGA